jgi:hypothetical protein
MLKLFALFSLAAFAFGQNASAPPVCDFVVVMYSNVTTNNCFEGWPIKQAANLAGPVITAWQEKTYPGLITQADGNYAVPILSQTEYDLLDDAGKTAYEQAQKEWGYKTAYDKTYPYYKDLGYRNGWKAEYLDKVPNATDPDAPQPMAAPHAFQPVMPGPLPNSTEVSIGNTIWYIASYKKGWFKGTSRGLRIGEKDGKANGKIARERGDDFPYAYKTGYSKGYDDASAGLSAAHRHLNHRKLRGDERLLTERFLNGYNSGYELAQQQRELGHAERRLPQACVRACQAHYHNPNYNYNQCRVLGRFCQRRRRTQETTMEHVYTLPLDGISGGDNFKNLIAHVIGKKCSVVDADFEIWKECPVTSS